MSLLQRIRARFSRAPELTIPTQETVSGPLTSAPHDPCCNTYTPTPDVVINITPSVDARPPFIRGATTDRANAVNHRFIIPTGQYGWRPWCNARLKTRASEAIVESAGPDCRKCFPE